MEINNGIIKMCSNKSTEKEYSTGTSVLDPKLDIESKIVSAKFHAKKEIKDYIEHTEKYIDFLKNTALFSETSFVIEQIMLEQYLKEVVEPVLSGKIILGMDKTDFNSLRKDMFKTLINKYVDTQENEVDS